ncbi:UMF1 family MFS transporter [Arcticibacter pallidicorallinus]|uniref:UMF1 family MFS transporter n=1 Tax=Arcticibacter pallidicorallinus TaxID=1259464 RepID=A0A2T0U5D3_9SPHI|nr:MFS transporter [Arcticibacter pallidicorallinus]PRY53110.1 UMF1 family MFS transporter [Arcticibacter pallidicorallinus]
MQTIKNDKKTIRSWAMFDWSNSAYNLVITSTIFPAYYTIITTTEEHGDKVSFFGFTFVNTALSNYSLSVAYLIMALLLPFLSSSADYHGNKKTYMKFFTYMGSLACMLLFFFKLETLELGIICSAIAAMGYIGGVMFSNSYLPEIASVDQQDKVSAQGFAYGYVGSVLLQIICFVFVLKPDWFGITDLSFPPRFSFLLVGFWWILFAQIPFSKLPKNSVAKTTHVRKNGYQELLHVFRQVRGMNVLKRFLLAFFFYSVGVQTIMLVAASFGEKELHLGTENLIMIILVIQVVAIGGAYLMSALGRKIGNIMVLILVVSVWIAICISAYFIATAQQFYLLAVVVGLVMGGIQSLSRSTYSKFLPENTPDTASFFSFYDVTEKLAIVLGLASFAFIEERSNIRNSALTLSLFFFIGLVILVFLFRTKEKTKISSISEN